ncbi:hypothetical protein H4Q26_018110 [Puccinia striiformis f. sp. tritici PST-130]|nr:hypothetical protein H4Q26_018110 [Puccinia striiformis f. sp. tritici PST-130]
MNIFILFRRVVVFSVSVAQLATLKIDWHDDGPIPWLEQAPSRAWYTPDDDDRATDGAGTRAGRPTDQLPVLAFSYPLKLIVTRPYRNDRLKLQLGLVYLLNYGGGLLSGDEIALDIQLDENCQLLCLSQGSTKVFKQKDRPRNQSNRESLYPATGSQAKNTAIETTGVSRQNITAKIGRNALLLMLPSYVTCFRDSSFVQKQIYHLEDHSSSLICLDWFTSGRSLSTRLPDQDESKRQESWTLRNFNRL